MRQPQSTLFQPILNGNHMPTAAIYARSSTVETCAVSIDNQVSACRRAAAIEGLVVDDRFVFRDNNPRGSSKTHLRRFGWERLIDAIKGKQIDVLFMEDVLRATRDLDQVKDVMSLMEIGGLRIVTTDGLDTAMSDWKSRWLSQLLASSADAKWTAVKTARGMLGKLERGFQVSVAPFGFKRVREQTEWGSELGTIWEIESDKAELIRTMYSMRQCGKTHSEIAQYLNTSEVAPPSPRLCHGFAFWRPSTVQRILSNKIYRGIYVWNGSARAKALAIKGGRVPDEREFERPHLRIVSDETWAACNRPTIVATVGVGG
jgi:DNA invertase Pin-like site-specific DNA recombinase